MTDERKHQLDLIADATIDHLDLLFELPRSWEHLQMRRVVITSHVLNALDLLGELNDEQWSDEQIDFATGLFDDAISHIKTRWKAMRSTGDDQPC